MADKDAPPKGPERRPGEGSSSAPKRPVSTIDLKATEVSPKPQAQNKEAGASAGKTVPSEGPQTPETRKDSIRPAQDQAGAAARVVAASAAASARRSEAVTSSNTAPGARAPSNSGTISIPDIATARGKLGGYGSHVAAGVGGGLLALLGSYLLDLPSSHVTSTAGDIQDIGRRLASLEQSTKERSARLEVIESGLARTDSASKTVGALNEAYMRLSEQSKALQEAVARLSNDGEPSRRIGKLEEQLAAIAAAAATDPNSRIPQLAQITGKLSDLETATAERLAGLRKDVTQDIETRVKAIAEASEAARSGAQMLDREVAATRSEATRQGQRIDALKAGSDRVEQALRTLQTDAGGLKSALDAFKSEAETQIRATAKPADVSAALAPVAAKVSSLEQSVQGVVRAEEDRRVSAERIVLSLQLGDLKRAMDRGKGYAAELAPVKKLAGGRIDLGPLERYQHDGIPAQAELVHVFRSVTNAILDADAEPTDASVVDRLLSGARSIVRVRKVTHSADDTSTEAIVGRMEAALKEGRLGDVLAEAKKLPAKAAVPAYDWLKKVEVRQSVDAAITSIDSELKASLERLTPAGQKGDGR